MTYSIIGRDPAAGEIGIAVQSRWFNARQDVAWIEPGVGAVCTQAMAEPAYGPSGLELLRSGSAFWRATMLAGAGRLDEAVTAFSQAVRAHPGWPDYLRNCLAAGLVPPQAQALADALV
jgi:hypothetical protein